MPNDALLVVKDRIAALQTRKTELLHKLQQVKQEILIERARRGRLTNQALPVASLPNEVLSTIFLLCRGTKMAVTLFLDIPMEFVLSHVSTHWRSVALDTASLWSEINLYVTAQTRKYVLKRLSLQLKRSAQCLLDISLRYDFYGTSEILDHLTPHAQRWFRLLISSKEGYSYDLFAPLQPLSVPNLIYLSLRIKDLNYNPDDYWMEYPEKCSTILIQGAPSLTFFRIAGKFFGHFAPLSTTIRTFHIDNCPSKRLSPSQFHSLLAALPCLVNLSLNGLGIVPRDSLQTIEPLVLPSLRSLRINGRNTWCDDILSLLSLPNLGSLLLTTVSSYNKVVIPSLHSLTLRRCCIYDHQFPSLSRSLPRLTTFDFDDWAYANVRIYHLLTSDVGPSTSVPWPELQTIILRQKCVDQVGFLNACLRRSECGFPLRRVCLDRISRSSMDEKILDRLRELQPVEYIDEDEPWPADLGYEDPDDTWW